jgi:GT2 family glycosyltransferase
VTAAAYSLVIPCYELPAELDRTLAGVATQTRLPTTVIVVDSSRDRSVLEVAESWRARLPMRYERAEIASAAAQRNQGAGLVDATMTPVVGFIDDDISLAPDACQKVCEIFEADSAQKVGGVALRIDEILRPEPKGWIWLYYRLQAGFFDRTYGARLFGPAINCLPCYTEGEGDLIAADWLNSGCVFYRIDVFQRELFPNFEGYSFMEDVHLSARIAKTHRLYFHKSARCQHRDGAAARPRGPVRTLARMRVRNQRLIARDVLGLRGPVFELKLLLHRLFATVAILRSRPAAWRDEILGTWI